jgi:hypothetical protein
LSHHICAFFCSWCGKRAMFNWTEAIALSSSSSHCSTLMGSILWCCYFLWWYGGIGSTEQGPDVDRILLLQLIHPGLDGKSVIGPCVT